VAVEKSGIIRSACGGAANFFQQRQTKRLRRRFMFESCASMRACTKKRETLSMRALCKWAALDTRAGRRRGGKLPRSFTPFSPTGHSGSLPNFPTLLFFLRHICLRLFISGQRSSFCASTFLMTRIEISSARCWPNIKRAQNAKAGTKLSSVHNRFHSLCFKWPVCMYFNLHHTSPASDSSKTVGRTFNWRHFSNARPPYLSLSALGLSLNISSSCAPRGFCYTTRLCAARQFVQIKSVRREISKKWRMQIDSLKGVSCVCVGWENTSPFSICIQL
jgi:hypothetical protein